MSADLKSASPPSPVSHWTVCAMVVLVPLALWPGLRDYTLPPKILVVQLGIAAVLVSWIASGGGLRLGPLALPALVYAFSCSVSVVYATDPLDGLLELTKILTGLLLFVAVSNQLVLRRLPTLMQAWIATGLVVSVIGIAEYLGTPLFDLPSAGLPSATLGYRNIAAMYLIQTIPFSVAVILFARERIGVYLGSLSTATMLTLLVSTRTRGAWMGLIVSGLVVAAITLASRRRLGSLPLGVAGKTRVLAATLGLAVGLAFLPSGLRKIGPQSIDEKKTDLGTAITSIARPQAGRGRLVLWEHTLQMIADHPLWGVGLGNWDILYPPYDHGDRVSFAAAPERPHNDFLWILSEVGLLGFGAYLWLGVAAICAAWRCLCLREAQPRVIAAACLAGLVAITVHSIFAFPRERATPTFLFWLSLGILALIDPQAARTKAPRGGERSTIFLALLLNAVQVVFVLRLALFERHMHAALRAEGIGDWAEVAAHTGAAVGAGRLHPEALQLRGYALNRLGRYGDSVQFYNGIAPYRPHDIQILNGHAIACQNAGDLARAESLYLRALATVPGVPDLRYNLAGLYLKMRDPGRAVAEYEAVLALEGGSTDLYYRLGTARSLSGDTVEATVAYRRARALSPGDARVVFALADLLYRTGQNAAALAEYRQFLEMWRGNPEHAETARRRIEELESLDLD